MTPLPIINRIRASIRLGFDQFKRSLSDKWKNFQNNPKIVVEKFKSTPTSTKIGVTAICIATPLLFYTIFIKQPPVQETPYIKPTPTSNELTISELIEARQKRRSAICTFSTKLALTFKYDGDKTLSLIKKQTNQLVLNEDPELVPFPNEEKEKLLEYGLYCATIAY